MKGKYLITTAEWFIAPDGQMYKAAWGEVEIVKESNLGIIGDPMKPNFYLKVGSESNHVIIPGSQMTAAIRSENKPSTEPYLHEDWHEGKLVKAKANSRLYIAE